MKEKLGELVSSRTAWSQILDSLMPGGMNWAQYLETGDCHKSCPGWAYCNGYGPGGQVCSTDWRRAETNPLVLSVVRHVLQNYKYYDRGDCTVSKKDDEVRLLLGHLNRQSDIAGDDEYAEGDAKVRLQKYRERHSKAAKDKKTRALADGHLCCEACGIDFLSVLSQAEALRVVECHHKIPLHSLTFQAKTTLSDLALLCANCHRLAHSKNPPLTIRQVSSLQSSVRTRLRLAPQ